MSIATYTVIKYIHAKEIIFLFDYPSPKPI